MSLNIADLADTVQTLINTTSLWYGTSDAVGRGEALVSEQTTPPFVIVHPDDVGLLGHGARHLREYRPTRAEMAAQAAKWFEEQMNQPMVFCDEKPDDVRWVLRRHWGR